MDHASGEWGLVRADWVKHPEVGPDEFALLALLSLYADHDGACWPSQSTLAVRLKRSRSWVIRVLNTLEAVGLVARAQRQAARGRKATCLYTLVGHDAAVAGTPAAHRVAPLEHEHRIPANAGLSHGARPGGESRAFARQRSTDQRATAKTVPPEGWAPAPADRTFAAEHAPGVDVDRFARLFVESCRSHGYRYADHGAAFRAWLLNRWEKPDAARSARSGDAARAPARPAARRPEPDARTAANRDTALAALALLAGGHS